MMLPKWRTALIEEIERSKAVPFAYGSHDCLQWPARAVKVSTGVDHAAGFPVYAEPSELLAAHGGVLGILTSRLGEPRHPSQSCDGWVVMAEVGAHQIGGVCFAGTFWFAREPVGLVPLPRRAIKWCWPPC